MAYTLNFGGTVNNTNGYTSWPGTYVYTDGFAFPTGNPDINGDRVVEVNDVNAAYATGAGGISPRILHNGVETTGGGTRFAGGGTFRFLIRYSSGTLRFGRDDNSGGTVVDAGDGGTWAGRLVGSMVWVTNSTAPSGLTATRTDRDVRIRFSYPSSDGGAAISTYTIQYRRLPPGGSWSGWMGSVSNVSGDYTFTDLLAGYTYQFRVYANNAVGSSPPATTGNILIPSAIGKRYSGSAWIDLTTGKRYTGSAWTDFTTAKRYTGSAWVDINN